MRYLLCLLPPIAVLVCGKPIQALLNVVLTLCVYFPGVIHAIFVVSSYNADKRTQKVVDAIQQSKT